MATTTTRLGLKVIDTPAVDTVAELRQSINNHATILDAQYLESTYALRPAAAQKGRIHRSTDTGEIAVDTGSAWEPLFGPPSVSRSVLEVGQVGQTRAGRQLTAADFTECGLAAPLGLWNLGDLTDVSGNSRTLANKGSVTFGTGIEGSPSSAAVFTGQTTKALYISDTGGSDPFRIRAGSWGCWIRTAKRSTTQAVLGKMGGAGSRSYLIQIEANTVAGYIYGDGTNSFSALANVDVCDDRWHHVVVTYDGLAVRMYVDGLLESVTGTSGIPIFAAAGPLNIGAQQADGVTAATAPHFGRVDEAFITNDVLSADQVRHLYGVKLAHGLGTAPRRVSLRATRRRRGAPLANGDFPSNPVRAYNLSGASLAELNAGTALTATGGVTSDFAGPDGSRQGAHYLSGGNHLQATDAGLPSGTNPRSYGAWFNAPAGTVNAVLLSWGTTSTGHAAALIDANGTLAFASAGDVVSSGIRVGDGQWHHFAVVEDNTAQGSARANGETSDGVLRRLYLDGQLVAASTVMNSITLAGANAMRVGANPNGTSAFTGALARVWVFAGALTADQIRAVSHKATVALQPSAKDATQHVEGSGATSLVFIGDDLEPQDLIDLEVSR